MKMIGASAANNNNGVSGRSSISTGRFGAEGQTET